MKQDTLTTELKAMNWWCDLHNDSKFDLAEKHQLNIDSDYPESYNPDQVKKLYLLEHPQEQDNTVSEDDLLEGEEFKTIGIIKELRAENKRLSVSNKELVEALVEWINLRVHVGSNGIETIDANNKTERAAIVKAKAALSNK